MSDTKLLELESQLRQAWVDGDKESFLSLCADDIVWMEEGWEKPLTGKDAIRDYVGNWMRAIGGGSATVNVVDRVAGEGAVAVELEIEPSGSEQGPSHGAYVARFSDDRVARIETFLDTSTPLAQRIS